MCCVVIYEEEFGKGDVEVGKYVCGSKMSGASKPWSGRGIECSSV